MIKKLKNNLISLIATSGIVSLLGSSITYGSTKTDEQALQIGKQLIDQVVFPELTKNTPDWLKRVEFEWQVTRGKKPEYSIWTVQPLYQSNNNSNTIFTQARINEEAVFEQKRTSTNIGIGYRKLLFNNKVLTGVNSFYDRQSKSDHSRVSYGGELRWANFDLFANYYRAISSTRLINDYTERALDGYDIELRTALPFIPWITISATEYEWKKKSEYASSDLQGWKTNIEARLSPNFVIEAGINDHEKSKKSFFLQTRFKIATSKEKKKIFNLYDSKIFRLEDMSDKTLTRVRRQDKIVIEREVGSNSSSLRGAIHLVVHK